MSYKKDIRDYLHLYLDCEVMEVGNNKGKLYAIGLLGGDGKQRCLVDCSSNDPYWTAIDNLKPLLRRLSDMTEEEYDTCWNLMGWNERIKGLERLDGILAEFDSMEDDQGNSMNSSWKYLIIITPYLLKCGFDLFGLIDSQLALETKTQPK